MSGSERTVPVRAITAGPGYHWFGYYDKLQFDPTCRYVLGMEVDFEHRSPTAGDVITVGMVDLQNGDRWVELGTSRAWCWQQGCMLQWLPGSRSKVIWNDRDGDHFVCHVLDVYTGRKRTLPQPVYTISPDGRWAINADFARINHMRPGYGYAGLPDVHCDELAPSDGGIRRLDLQTGKHELIVSIADVAHIPYPHADLSAAKHYFNHLLFNPDGSRFEFLHRWRMQGQTGLRTRMFTAALDGSDIRVVDDNGRTSHFIWRDPTHILAWSSQPSLGEAFYLFEDGSRQVEVVGQDVMTRDGHCTYLPGNQWILNDGYPDERGERELYLYHVAERRKITLGRYHSPALYQGEWRCDLHPRFSPDGQSVVIDSPHDGRGRQMYLLDISQIVGRPP